MVGCVPCDDSTPWEIDIGICLGSGELFRALISATALEPDPTRRVVEAQEGRDIDGIPAIPTRLLVLDENLALLK